jgi:hypothetical protein
MAMHPGHQRSLRLGASAVVATIVLRRAAARTVMVFGILALITGVTVTVIAVSLGSAAVFFAGSAIASAGFGSGFQGGIRTVVPLAAPHQRARQLHLLYDGSGQSAPMNHDPAVAAAARAAAATLLDAALPPGTAARPGR